ncbi:hypothetical protein CHLNCDRAFT_141807 [Chlorella variabilis]|uniref:Uncharacterized protein n=1 Tax=Chlorella variabilis TaxID=554065 RepID=E1ZTN1_CHLVA|nr:hypothetical protein CHLNCDRAFT_141807 [Chlorella variabilis]EFN50868.1 hypothetical protein CHLNCDRAFT_141807 [Chlorella variabilis]|eukprot:XP_005842970.1 hypothetical protein CHLNCDRAFT_141807 [Chlorella variabilis]
MGRRRLLLLSVAAVAAVATGALLLILHGGSAEPRYVLVIDAGSSGTRMYAYTWHDGSGAGVAPLLAAVPSSAAAHKVPRRAMPGRRAYQRVETEPGLDQFVGDGQGLQAKALGPLLEWAEAVVPRWQWKQTPMFLFGTAGLRRLSAAQQEGLLEGVRDVLQHSVFRFSPPWARIISGVDEGVYGWVALNYMEGTLRRDNTGADTLGALDLGGSSLEVTFAAHSVPWPEDAVNATVLGASHQLYAHVHHHYGLNDAFDRSPSSAGHRFVALTGFFVVYKFFRLTHNASAAALEEAGQQFCAKSWAQAQQDRPGELMLENYCFRACC